MEDKAAIVTGAGRGVFRAVALQMALAGAKVVVVDTGGSVRGDPESSDPQVAISTAAEIRNTGGVAVACSESVATRDGAGKIAATALDSFGRIDILVNGAGIIRQNMVWDMSDEDFDAVISTHLIGSWNCVQAVLPSMMRQEVGAIVNCSSGVGVVGRLASSNYAAAKAGLIGLTLAAALDLGPLGIRVNALCPIGYSRMMDEEQDWQSRYAAEPQGLPSHEQYPVEAVAPLVVYLTSDAAADVNGQVFECGGGMIGWYPLWRTARHIEAEDGLLFGLDELSRRVPKDLLEGIANPAPRQSGPDRVWPVSRRG